MCWAWSAASSLLQGTEERRRGASTMSSDCAGSNLALCAKPPRMVASDSSRRTCARERRWEITLSAVFRKRKCPPRDVTEAAHDLASRERVTTAIDPRDRTPSGAYSMHWRFEMKIGRASCRERVGQYV